MMAAAMKAQSVWPQKLRELHNHHFDSTIWNDFAFRDDDIIIGTYAKSGTTWTQQIVAQLIFAGAEGLDVAGMSPWVDLRVPPKDVKLSQLEAMTHRRFLKTHLPVDALVFSPRAKYIYLGRDGRDVVWSMYNHHANANALWYQLLNDTPGRVGPAIEPPPASIRRYFYDWLELDGFPFWPFWENIRGWWDIRDLPNVMLLHYADMKADMEGNIRRVAEFLEIDVPEDKWPAIFDHCSFDHEAERRSVGSPQRCDLEGRGRNLRAQGHQRPLARHAECRGIRPLRTHGRLRARPRMCGLAERGRGWRGA